MKTFLQRSGETLYMPNLILHSVWNLSSTISLGNNPLYKSSFVEHLGSGGSGMDDISQNIRKKIKSINNSEMSGVVDQINAAIRSHQILKYFPPKIWKGYDNFCLEDIKYQSKRTTN